MIFPEEKNLFLLRGNDIKVFTDYDFYFRYSKEVKRAVSVAFSDNYCPRASLLVLPDWHCSKHNVLRTGIKSITLDTVYLRMFIYY